MMRYPNPSPSNKKQSKNKPQRSGSVFTATNALEKNPYVDAVKLQRKRDLMSRLHGDIKTICIYKEPE
jgi:hypothetical protein